MALAGIINTVVTSSAWLALKPTMHSAAKWKITDSMAFPISDNHQIKDMAWM